MTPRGMTLIELLVAIAIVGILSAMVTPGYRIFVQKMQMQQAKGQLQSWHLEQLRYALVNGQYATVENLSAAESSYYEFNVENVGFTTFTLVAEKKEMSEALCDKLTIDQNALALPLACW